MTCGSLSRCRAPPEVSTSDGTPFGEQPRALAGGQPGGPRGVTFTVARAALGGGGELTLYRRAPPGAGRKDQMRL